MLSDVLEFCEVIKFNWGKGLLGETTIHYFNRVLKMLVISNSAVTPYLYSFTSTRTPARPPSVPGSLVHRTTSSRLTGSPVHRASPPRGPATRSPHPARGSPLSKNSPRH